MQEHTKKIPLKTQVVKTLIVLDRKQSSTNTQHGIVSKLNRKFELPLTKIKKKKSRTKPVHPASRFQAV